MIFASLKMFVGQIYSDSMIAVATSAPLLAGAAFRFGFPAAERLLAVRFGGPVLSPWYLLIDLFLAVLAPYMLCFASAMVILEERDCGIAAYLAVTPVGRVGYFASRLAFPAAIAGAASFAVLSVFGLSGMGIASRALASLGSAVVALTVSLLVVAASRNRIEGMAVAKLCGLVLLGVAVPFIADSPRRFAAAFLPTFWMGEAAVRFSPVAVFAFAAVSVLWLLPLLAAAFRDSRRTA